MDCIDHGAGERKADVMMNGFGFVMSRGRSTLHEVNMNPGVKPSDSRVDRRTNAVPGVMETHDYVIEIDATVAPKTMSDGAPSRCRVHLGYLSVLYVTVEELGFEVLIFRYC